MKDTHKYSNNFKEKEYQKAIQFLEKGCECGCSATLPKERFAILRNSFQKLTFLEKDAFVMGQLTNTRGGDMTTSSRFPKHERTNRRNFYIFEHNKPICQETFLNMLGISQKYLKNMKKHLVNKGIYTRIHGNTGKTPFRKTKILVDLNVREEVRDFVLNYARTHGLPNPGRVKRANNITIYLPTEMTYKSVHEDFLNSLEADSALRELRYRVFVKIWKQLTPQIGFMSPRSDLCDTCQKFHRDLKYSCLDKETKKKKIDQHLQHLTQAQLERDYYNENTRLAREDRKLVEENWIQKQGKVGYKTVDAIAHCSFDWSQNPSIPYSSQQVSQLYFLTTLKVYLFGIQNEATNEQLNFVLAEDELLNKGINGTLSMVLAGIKYFNRGEKHLKLTCDNCVGQNKNNATIRFCQFLVMAGYYETVELNFMIAGHTKFSPDRGFGMTKKLYWKSTVCTKEQFEEVVKKSSFLNKVQCYENGQGFQYFDFKETFEKFFKNLLNINKYHHFLIESSNLGVAKVQEFANWDFIEIDLWKDKGRIIENTREIKILTFPILKPKPLSLERQQYLYEKIRPLLPEKYWNNITDDWFTYKQQLKEIKEEFLYFSFQDANSTDDKARFYIRSKDKVFGDYFEVWYCQPLLH